MPDILPPPPPPPPPPSHPSPYIPELGDVSAARSLPRWGELRHNTTDSGRQQADSTSIRRMAASAVSQGVKYDTQADAWALLALKEGAQHSPEKMVNGGGAQHVSKGPIAKIQGKEFEYSVRQARVVIGRNSSTQGDVDIHLGNSSFISRAHVEILFEQQQFYLKCNGKNGIFMDGQFQRKSAPPLAMPKR